MLYVFSNELSASRLDQVVDAAIGPRLWLASSDYPDQLDWAHRAHGELKTGSKRIMVAFDHQEVVGSVIYQRSKSQPWVLEIKRISIEPAHRGRRIAGFLLSNAEREGLRDFADVTLVQVDTKLANREFRAFIEHHGYRLARVDDLYGLGAGLDAVYRKPLDKRKAPTGW